jgi:hypothetical protein
VNWLFEVIAPISRLLAEHLVNGLILSATIYLAFRILRPLFLNRQRGSAATSHRVLSLVFVALAITPILTRLQPVRLSMNGLGQQPSTVSVAVPGPPEPSIFDGQIQETLLGEPGPSQPVFFGWVQTIDWPVIVAAVWAGLACVLLVRLLLALNSLWTLHRRVRILVLPESFTSRLSQRLCKLRLRLGSGPRRFCFLQHWLLNIQPMTGIACCVTKLHTSNGTMTGRTFFRGS